MAGNPSNKPGEMMSDSRLSRAKHAPLYERYANSIYGKHHSKQPLRFSAVYGYDRARMLSDLGDDVHPVRHQAYTVDTILIPLIDEQNRIGDEHLTPDQIDHLVAGTFIHDTGENTHPEILKYFGEVVGDIPWEQKTKDHSVSETAIRQYLYKRLYPKVSADFLATADSIIDNDGDDSFVNAAFTTTEKIGYYTSAIQAGRVALQLYEQRIQRDELRFIRLSQMALRVTDNHRQTLETDGARFPYAKTVLQANEALDSRIHASLSAQTS